MDTTKIKVKIGVHEFEAEGPTNLVKEQFDSFKELIRLSPSISNSAASSATPESSEKQEDTTGGPHVSLEKIIHSRGRVVSLTALPKSTEDAALLILLGHKDLRNNLSVTGQEIGDGLAQSGRLVNRVDRVMESALKEALVLKTGVKRSTRYRLTNQGLVKALELARELIASLP